MDSKTLTSRGRICAHLEIGKSTFYALVEAGLPVRRFGRRWMAHAEVLDRWLAEFTARGGSVQSPAERPAREPAPRPPGPGGPPRPAPRPGAPGGPPRPAAPPPSGSPAPRDKTK